MNCTRSAHLDLAAFLAGEESSEIDAFRAHYPSCPDCSAAVRTWTELHTDLGPRPSSGQHPSEELLLRFEAEPEKMSAVARTSVETHLKACASCRDELQTLRNFDFSILQRSAAGRPQTSPDGTGERTWWRSFLAPVRTVLLHPAFAYGLVLLLLLPQAPHLLPRRGPTRMATSKSVQDQPVTVYEVAPEAERPRESTGPRSGPAEVEERLARLRNPPPAAVGGDAAYSNVDADRLRGEAHLARRKRAVESFDAEGTRPKTGSEQTEEAAPAPAAAAKSAGQVALADKAQIAEQPPYRQVTIVMDPSGRNNIPMRGMLDGAILHIKPQQPVGIGSDVAIRVKSADGRRELREIHTATRGDGYLEMTIPPGWMADGLYSVEVWPLDALPASPRHRHPQAFR